MKATCSGTLRGSVALVTGARGGIGAAVCEALSNAGACVAATGLGNSPSGAGYDAWFHHDVSSREDWLRVISEIEKRFGRLDCLINNAGVSLVERIADTSIEAWRQTFSVNVEGVLLGVQVALALLRASGCNRMGGSSVVNISSTAGLRGIAFGAAYSASKGAVTLFSKSAAKEFSALNYPIRVNSVHPGAIETRMIDRILQRYVECGISASVDAQRAAFRTMAPMGRMGVPKEIAAGVVYLCSPAASYITGTELVIDGGVTA